MNKWKVSCILVATTFLLAACINIPIGDGNKLGLSKDGISIIDDEGDEVSISMSDNNETLTISGIEDETGESGEMTFGTDLDVPEAFPKDLPMPKDANIVIATEMDGGAMIQYVTDTSLEQLEELYKKYYDSGTFQEAPNVERMDASDMSFVVYTAPYDNNWLTVYMSRGVSSGEQSEVAITLDSEQEDYFEQ